MWGKQGIREPAVAGQFYPATRDQLKRDIDRFLENSPLFDVGHIVALVAPHAGYMYSGRVAAAAYKQIQGQNIDIVVVLAPSHVEPFAGSSIYGGNAYVTPLGTIPVHQTLREQIAQRSPDIAVSDHGHNLGLFYRQEHSLEVQLPFLQCVLDSFSLIPIVMGDQSRSHCEALAEALSEALSDQNALIVASSDLSHFHPYDEAVRLDRVVIDSIEAFNDKKLSQDLTARRCEACGGGPIVTAMITAKALGADQAKVLMYANSGDVTGDRHQVVGYLSAAFSKANPVRGGIERGLTDPEKEQLLRLARRTLEHRLKGESPPSLSSPSSSLQEKRGAFVTLTKQGQLRGCIGYIEGLKPLWETVREMVEAAAFRDPRFPPLTDNELRDVRIEISVLTPLKKISDVKKIQVGVHGIVITKGYHHGLLLPQVATEYGWDRETFLEHTCQKAGLPKGAWKDPETKIEIFSADVFGET